MKVRKKDMANYLGVCLNSASKHYQSYLDILETKRKYLTVFDISYIDQIPVNVVCNIMGVMNPYLKSIGTIHKIEKTPKNA